MDAGLTPALADGAADTFGPSADARTPDASDRRGDDAAPTADSISGGAEETAGPIEQASDARAGADGAPDAIADGTLGLASDGASDGASGGGAEGSADGSAVRDTGAEPGPEAAPDQAAERTATPGPETGAERGPEAGPEAGRGFGPETGPEAGPEASGGPRCPTGDLCDDFEDGNLTANPTWTAPAGFTVTTDGSKVLAYTGNSSPAIASLGGAATALTIKAMVKATTFGGTSNSYRVGVFGRIDSQVAPSTWYGLTVTGDGSLRLQVTDSTPSGCGALAGVAVPGTWYVLTLGVSGTVASTTLQGTLTDVAGGNVKTIGPCTIAGGLAAGFAGVGIRGANTQGEFDDVEISNIVP
jgi:hypothetical protein